MKTSLSPILLAIAGLLFAACGKSSDSAAPASASVPDDGIRLVAITGNDAMQFSVTEIKAKTGEKLRIQFSNIGKMPKQAMAHNWVLLQPMDNAAINAFGMKASMKAPDYLPDDLSAVIAHTKLLGAGESDLIEFSAPSAPGEYPFVCTFPGHYAIMKGKLIVE